MMHISSTVKGVFPKDLEPLKMKKKIENETGV